MSLRKAPDRVTDLVFLALALSLVIAGVHLIVNSGITGRFVVGEVGSAPHVSLTSPADGVFITGDDVTLVCGVTSMNVSNVSLFTNISGNWSVDGVSYNHGSSVSALFSMGSVGEGVFGWNCLAYDDSGYSSYAAANSTFIVDSAPPSIVVSGLPEELVYSPGNTTLNISWSDAVSGVDGVWLDFNGSDVPVNVSSGNASVSLGSLAAGNYSYSWSASDAAGNLNASSANLSVIRAAPSLVLLLNSTDALSVEGGDFNLTAGVLVGEGPAALYLDGVLVDEDVWVNRSGAFSGQGVRNITLYYAGTRNYSSALSQLFIFVTGNSTGMLMSPAEGHVSSADVNISCSMPDALNMTIYSNISGAWSGSVSSVGADASLSAALDEGRYAWGCVASLPSGNAVGSPRKFTVDRTAPVLRALPANITVNYSDDMSFSVDANDPSGIAEFSVNDSRFVISSSGIVGFAAAPSTGHYDLLVSAGDVVGNSAGSVLAVDVVDHVPPVVSLDWPRDGDLTRDSAVLGCSASDLSLSAIVVYSNISGSWSSYSADVNLSAGTASYDTGKLHDADYVWNCMASDGGLSAFAPANRTFSIAGEKSAVSVSGSAVDDSASSSSSSSSSQSSSGGSGAGVCAGVSCPDRCEQDYLKRDGTCIVVDGGPFCRYSGGELCDHGCRDAECLADLCEDVECSPLTTVCSDGSISQCVPQCVRGNCLSCAPSCAAPAPLQEANLTVSESEVLVSSEGFCGDSVCDASESAEDCPADCHVQAKRTINYLVLLILIVLVFMVLATSYTVYNVVRDSRKDDDIVRLNPTKQDAIGIDSFIRAKLSEGVSPDALKSLLVSKGWPVNIVNYYVAASAKAGHSALKRADRKKKA
ncbi:hypothetical protein KY363_07670 [Candidatus Woesearchaeota archaeon]|nr:hypothetical protein [Candidatus Woesearchaeota archaeon]